MFYNKRNKEDFLLTHVIHKYPIPSDPSTFNLELPIGAQILDIQLQGNKPQMWVLKEEGMHVAHTTRNFIVVATGFPFELENFNYLGTFQHGPLVWHVLEDLN